MRRKQLFCAFNSVYSDELQSLITPSYYALHVSKMENYIQSLDIWDASRRLDVADKHRIYIAKTIIRTTPLPLSETTCATRIKKSYSSRGGEELHQSKTETAFPRRMSKTFLRSLPIFNKRTTQHMYIACLMLECRKC